MSGVDVCCVLFRLCGDMGSDKTKTKNPTLGAAITNTDLSGCDKNEVFPPLASFYCPIFQKVPKPTFQGVAEGAWWKNQVTGLTNKWEGGGGS